MLLHTKTNCQSPCGCCWCQQDAAKQQFTKRFRVPRAKFKIKQATSGHTISREHLLLKKSLECERDENILLPIWSNEMLKQDSNYTTTKSDKKSFFIESKQIVDISNELKSASKPENNLKNRRQRQMKQKIEISSNISSQTFSSNPKATLATLLTLALLLNQLSSLPIHTSATVQVVELGEGLTLQQQQQQQQQQQHDWPLKQLDKIKAESSVSAVVGQNVILNCAVQFKDGHEKPFVVNWLKYPHKLPIYIWYAGYPPHVAQGYEQRVARLGQASLNLSAIRESDQGLYECKIYYLDRKPEDKANGTWIFLDVQAPPHFTLTPAPISYVQAGDSLHLTCQAQSTPAPILRWYKNKVPIESDAGAYRLSSNLLPSSLAVAAAAAASGGGGGHSLTTGTDHHNQQLIEGNNNNNTSTNQLSGQSLAQLDLFIDNVQAGTTTGDYVCMASNSEGSIEARSQVVLAVPAVITTWPRNQTRLEGERVELLCQAKALPANITYKWLFNNKPVQMLKWFDGRITQKRDGTLVIHSLHRDDQGEYKCQATNGLSHRYPSSLGSSSLLADAQRHYLDQFSSPPDTTSPSSSSLSSSNDNISVGNNPPTQTTTTTSIGSRTTVMRNKKIKNNNNNSNNNTMLSSSNNSKHLAPAPIYAEASAHLSVEFSARVTYTPPVQFLPLGLAGQIRCFVQSIPPVEFFTWTLNNQQFDPNSDSNIERLQNGSLLIKQVNKSYEGVYRCTPFNKHGTAGSSGAMEVRVEEPPQFIMKPVEYYKANLNGQIKIPCDARGSPKPTVSWRRVIQVPKVDGVVEHSNDANNNNNNNNHNHKRAITMMENNKNSQTSDILNRNERSSSSLMSDNQSRLLLSFKQANFIQHQSGGLVDEAADEPDETHHFYAPTTTLASNIDLSDASIDQATQSAQRDTPDSTAAAAVDNNNLEQHQEQQTVIVYNKLPLDRSEFKNSHLHIHNLKKDDHGRYECVIENEIATLVAPTTLYIEETTPHAPTNVRVSTKVWSAHVAWQPGYDGGFEQSFVVWYRQVDRARASASSDAPPPPSVGMSTVQSIADFMMPHGQQLLNDLLDVNWHSISVPTSDSTSNIVVQNLSQDTRYEFYVRAKNVIGEGPRSQIVQATTKRAISGSVTPVNVVVGDESLVAASTQFNINTVQDEVTANSVGYEPSAEDESDQSSSVSPSISSSIATSSIRPYLIIHPEYVSAAQSTSTATATSNHFQQQQQQQVDEASVQNAHQSSASRDQSSDQTNSSNKVIRIYFPNTRSSENSSTTTTTTSSSTSGKKATRGQQTNSTSVTYSTTNDSHTTTQEPIDYSTAPQNVSMMKFAQGWVLSWQPPLRVPSSQTTTSAHVAGQQEHAEAIRQAVANSETSSSLLDNLAANQQRLSQQQQQDLHKPTTLAYTVEMKEKQSSNWLTFATLREQSMLFKDLRPGGEYQFRVFAHTIGGARGSPSTEFKYLIPDNRRKPGSSQAFSATVTSGILFFIASIVIAVCGVNMCNKRRKKRAEKAAYVMMACPVLESHHDIATLNSNSLLKNGTTNAAQNRVPGVTDQTTGGHLSSNLRFTVESVERKRSGRHNNSKLTNYLNRNDGTFAHWKLVCSRLFTRFKSALTSGLNDDDEHQSGNSTSEHEPHVIKGSIGHHVSEREIRFSSNEPIPVDVGSAESCVRPNGKSSPSPSPSSSSRPQIEIETLNTPLGQRVSQVDKSSCSASGSPYQTGTDCFVGKDVCSKQQNIVDDYWIRRPSDVRWGTLTLAASKLAERRAAKVVQQQQQQQQILATKCASADNEAASRQAGAQINRQELVVGVENCNNSRFQPITTTPSSSSALDASVCNSLLTSRRNNGANQTLPRSFRSMVIANHPTTTLYAARPSQVAPRNEALHKLQRQQMHQRSVSHVVESSAALECNNEQQQNLWRLPTSSSQCQIAANFLPPTNWTQQDLNDWASMSFGPPAPAPNNTGDSATTQLQTNTNSSHWPPAQMAAYPYLMPNRQCAWPLANNKQQQIAGEQTIASTNISNNWRPSWAFKQQQRRPVVGGDFVDALPVTAAGEAHANVSHALGKRNSLARSTLPLTAPPVNCGPTILAPAYNRAHDSRQPHHQTPSAVCPFYPPMRQDEISFDNDNDDSLMTANACFGSYKRKRRLPHIEAQFTITKAPELPASKHSLLSSCNQPDAAGGLFVREDVRSSLSTPPPPLPSPNPRGMPQAGQRSEQRRLRRAIEETRAISRTVDTIGASEKIETFLRHQHEPASSSRSSSNNSLKQQQQVVEMDKVDELTFQPYYNLPSLKYTISLPLERGENGQLLLQASAHLRPTRRKRRTTTTSVFRDTELHSLTESSNRLEQLIQNHQQLAHAYRHKHELSELVPPTTTTMTSNQLLLPPPVPPHRTTLRNKQQEVVNETRQVVEGEEMKSAAEVLVSAPVHSANEVQRRPCASSSSPNSTTSSSSSANNGAETSATTSTSATELGHDENSLINSVDESYEFDKVSSCSSSQPNRMRQHRDHIQHHHHHHHPRRPVGKRTDPELVYAQVDKGRERRRRRQQSRAECDLKCSTQRLVGDENARPTVERTRYYDRTRLKEHRLHDSMAGNLYDTVYETINGRTSCSNNSTANDDQKRETPTRRVE